MTDVLKMNGFEELSLNQMEEIDGGFVSVILDPMFLARAIIKDLPMYGKTVETITLVSKLKKELNYDEYNNKK